MAATPAQLVGISSGAVLLSLAELAHHVDHLSAGELRDAWVTAVGTMRNALEAGFEAHRELTGEPATTIAVADRTPPAR